jgi:hypothetical protein
VARVVLVGCGLPTRGRDSRLELLAAPMQEGSRAVPVMEGGEPRRWVGRRGAVPVGRETWILTGGMGTGHAVAGGGMWLWWCALPPTGKKVRHDLGSVRQGRRSGQEGGEEQVDRASTGEGIRLCLAWCADPHDTWRPT